MIECTDQQLLDFNQLLYIDFNLYCNSFYNRQKSRAEAEKNLYKNKPNSIL